MGKVEKITIKLAMLFIGLSLLFPARVLAAEKNEIIEITEKMQIIFLLDASKSMQGVGQWIEAADSACMIASALSKEYEVALLVYNTEIVYEEDFGNINQKTRHALETVELQGYTTPAVALETAADMFDSAAADKRVVFISDGEISLRDQSETETAIRQFENMVDQIAEQEIKIDMIEITNDKTENEVSYGTKVTSGEQYTVGENQTIEEITAKELNEKCQCCLKIKASDTAQAAILIEKNLHTKNYEILSDNNIRIFEYVDNPGIVNSLLVNHGISVDECTVTKESLEDYFNEKMRGGIVNA